MRKMMKFAALALFASLLSMCLMLIWPVQVQAASKKQETLKAYAETLSKSMIPWRGAFYPVKGKTSLEDSEFGLVYIDKDDIPELLVQARKTCHAEGYLALYTYKNGKVVEIDNMQDDFEYYPKKNMVQSIHSGTGGYERYYEIISGTKTKHYLYSVSEKESGWDVNYDGKIKGTHYGKAASSKSWNYKKITKSKFSKLLKKRVGKSKSVKPTFYQNTPANRKAILGN